MNPYDKALRQLPPKPVRDVIGDLLKLARQAEADESIRPPLVCLHMRSGHDLSGWIVSTGEPTNNTLLLHNPGPNPEQPWDHAVYVDQSDIMSMTIIAAGHVAHLLGKNIPPPPRATPSTPAPTKFETQRKAQDLVNQLASGFGSPIAVEINWDKAVQGGGEYIRALSDLVDHLQTVFSEWAADSTSKEAIRAGVKKIAISDGPSAGVRKNGDALEITETLSGTTSLYSSVVKLRAALSALL